MNLTRKFLYVFCVLVSGGTLLGWGRGEQARDWAATRDPMGFRVLTGVATSCSNCISLREVAVLGTDSLQGSLDDRGTIQNVVRDREGRYWAGQRTTIKVFAPDGRYLRSVGRAGQGPMEFAFAQPVHADSTGNVHVVDPRLGRETVIGPDFRHRTDRTMPVMFDGVIMVPGAGHRYLIAKWATAPGGTALPLHLVSGAETQRSFGLRSGSRETETVRGISGRVINVGPAGHVFSSQTDSYEIEAWTLEGERVAGFTLPGLNARPPGRGGLLTADNPPRNSVSDITAYDSRHVWVITRHLRSNWRDFMVERRAPDRGVYLESKDGMVSPAFRSRIDLLDLNTSSVVASYWQDGLLLRFIEPRLVLKLDYTEAGAPMLRVLEATIQRR